MSITLEAREAFLLILSLNSNWVGKWLTLVLLSWESEEHSSFSLTHMSSSSETPGEGVGVKCYIYSSLRLKFKLSYFFTVWYCWVTVYGDSCWGDGERLK